ncbi:MAG: Protein translocase subunit SecY [Candidatus Wolfebacteria bacterium GW2011_GWA2_42_10]|uniref:Protein translocase subunit SecY n=2 Tax=Candidatus Wolfeibacteriota TaxID=1752735 RepID=A0A0G0XL73_9BACT|nr:MAG: Protein translocase subunit SecY [Candidatus Wolfebacteria bacterium GW2011_GWB1_41_12]KKS25629.1 MAG: Protein translocase subunit SecY [Candidatus Wolfebacteria bacterium GW2011_GWA2_42_10]KKT56481.1 MAG: Protein translocase subunit SecY [Candidatus Wolfebacteria bacterium GW2011_GWA1_44_24]
MNKILQLFKIKDLRNKILVVAFLLFCFRAFSAVPIPDINAARLRDFFGSNQLFGFLSIFSGGALENLSIAMLGVAPYITATIIMQLLTMIFPALKEMYYEEGAAGRAKFNRYSRYLTVPLAALQSYGFLNLLMSQGVVSPLELFEIIRNVVLITAGSMILLWIGELISEQKIGNGISLIIFAGIVSQLPVTIKNIVVSYDPSMMPTYIAFVIVAILVIAGVVFIQEGERKIPIAYAKRVRGMKMYGGAQSYLPLKVNQAGVIPIIFAISILLFPQFAAQISSVISSDLSLKFNELVSKFFNNQYIYALLYFVLVVVFTYFYTAVTFDPKEISKNLQTAGGFIAGIRPGESTTIALSKIISRLTLSGALFLGLIAVLPSLIQIVTGIKFLTIGGTALLIVVSVALEIMQQVNSQLVMREYEGFE